MMPLGRISRFALVGAGIALLYIALYLVLLHLGVAQWMSNALAFGIAVVVQYAGQARFTFHRRLNDPRQMVRFAAMIIAGFLTSALITGIVAQFLAMPAILAAVAVTLVLPLQNFILMTLWVFSNPAT